MLQGKTAIITGSAAGIGEGIAHLFAEHGARLALVDCNTAHNEAVAHSLKARAYSCDLRDSAAINRVAEAIQKEIGPADILINNAGVYPRRALMETTEQEWDDMQAVNLRSVFLMTKAVLPAMLARGSGKIVNMSSVTFHLGMANLAHYVASKGGIIGLTRCAAREAGPRNVHVNCITPGAILVEAEKAVQTEEALQEILNQQSLKRRLLPIDIARTCLFLSSELSDGLTGQTLNVDGGWVMH
ncbi:MAG: SDR family oxidoreductase [Acidobacteriota bacterium]|nr:SDR family oxidoreductase [Acidobacteriota bacterium]